METETKNSTPVVHLVESEVFPGLFRVTHRDGSVSNLLSREELEALAQETYDRWGFVPQPSLDMEERVASEAREALDRAFGQVSA